MIYLEVLSAVQGHMERSASGPLWSTISGENMTRQRGDMAFEVSPSPSSVIVVSANYTVMKETKVFRFLSEGGVWAKSTLQDQNKQIFRTEESAKSTM